MLPYRPSHLLQYLHDARQQLLRAAALVHDTRKLPPLTQLVQTGGVLDRAASHARALQTTADELFKANGMLLFQRVPLFNVPDALDVLATGRHLLGLCIVDRYAIQCSMLCHRILVHIAVVHGR